MKTSETQTNKIDQNVSKSTCGNDACTCENCNCGSACNGQIVAADALAAFD